MTCGHRYSYIAYRYVSFQDEIDDLVLGVSEMILHAYIRVNI